MNAGEAIDLGSHRLVCGDAFNPEHRALLLQGEKPAMLYCDPPYGMRYDASDARMLKRPEKAFWGVTKRNDYPRVIGDHEDFDPSSVISDFASVDEQFWWGADYYAERIPDRNKGSWYSWDKRLDESKSRGFGSCFELCWSKHRHKREVIRILWSGFFGLHQEPERRRLHPTQKPIVLSEWFLERYSKPDALVLDLFAGSGSTLLACERMGRRAAVMEIDPHYCDVIIDRYEALLNTPTPRARSTKKPKSIAKGQMPLPLEIA